MFDFEKRRLILCLIDKKKKKKKKKKKANTKRVPLTKITLLQIHYDVPK